MFGWWKKRKFKKQFLKEMEYISQNIYDRYKKISIKKRTGGFREIKIPCDELKKVQRTILKRYLYNFKPSPFAHAFVKKRSIKTNAQKHVNKKIVVSIDIKDFFPSIKKDMIGDIFDKSKNVDDFKDQKLYDLVLDMCFDNGSLPQGAPTSPTLSNLVFSPIDLELFKLARKFKATYSRYADDLFFSSNKNDKLPGIIPAVEKILKKNRFQINYKKVRILRKGDKHVVAGVVCNEILSVGREKIRLLRAKIHKLKVELERNNLDYAKEVIPSLEGEISYYYSINPKTINRYKVQLKNLIKSHKL